MSGGRRLGIVALSITGRPAYGFSMSTMFLVLMALAMLAVLGSLFGGLIAMAKGGEFNEKYGNKLMRWRVMMQGLALALFAAAMLSAG